MLFDAGDRVVCVDGNTQQSFIGAPQDNFSFPNGFVVKGEHYTVKRAHQGSGGTQILEIEGVPVFLWTGELHGWHSHRFRKIESIPELEEADAEEEKEAVMVVPG